jgi:membrane fusion protein (multidrug efflux system)
MLNFSVATSLLVSIFSLLKQRNHIMISRLLTGSRVLAIFIAVLASCGSKDKVQPPKPGAAGGAGAKPPVRADAFIAVTKPLSDNIEIPGTIVAAETTELHPEVSGLITGIYFKEGSFVKKGALLVKLNDADLQAQKRKIAVQLSIARQNESRSSQLLQIQGISRQDYDVVALQVSNANADLAVLNTQIEKTNIRAPFSGKLGLRLVSTGAYLTPATIITTISQLSGLKIDFTVPERYIPQIALGQPVTFKVEGIDAPFTAKVIATQPSITENTRTLQVRGLVQGNIKNLVPGNFARVMLHFAPDDNAIVIPTQAIVPQARGKKVYIYKNGTADAVNVTTGLRDSATIQVTSGLKAGDTVLISGLLSLKPNGKVKLGKVVNAKGGGKAEGRPPDAERSHPHKRDNGTTEQ